MPYCQICGEPGEKEISNNGKLVFFACQKHFKEARADTIESERKYNRAAFILACKEPVHTLRCWLRGIRYKLGLAKESAPSMCFSEPSTGVHNKLMNVWCCDTLNRTEETNPTEGNPNE
jgi:hypothetical protein